MAVPDDPPHHRRPNADDPADSPERGAQHPDCGVLTRVPAVFRIALVAAARAHRAAAVAHVGGLGRAFAVWRAVVRRRHDLLVRLVHRQAQTIGGPSEIAGVAQSRSDTSLGIKGPLATL